MNTKKFCSALAGAALSFTVFGETPDEFLEYVQSDGTQYFDTGVIGRKNTKIAVEFMQINNTTYHDFAILGCTGSGSKKFWPWMNHYGYGFNYAGSFQNQGVRQDFYRHTLYTTLEKGRQTLGFNYTTETWSKSDSTDLDTGLSMYLFANNDNGTPVFYGDPLRVFSLKIWQKQTDDGEYELVRDYRACLKDGKAGLYNSLDESIIYPKDSSGAETTVAPHVRVVHGTTQGGMTPVEQLTNAFTQARSGDIIRIEPGTYRFTDPAMWMGCERSNTTTNRLILAESCRGVTVEGVGTAATPRKTWTYGAEPVVIDANGGRAIKFWGYDTIFRNLTITGGTIIHDQDWAAALAQAINKTTAGSLVTNCVFRGNYAKRVAAVYNVRCRDCLFKDNSTGNGVYRGNAGSDNAGAFSCDFYENTSSGSNSFAEYAGLFDCHVEGNTGPSGMNTSTIVSNCVFRSNTTTSSSFLSCNQFLDCVFESNVVKGACISGGVATNCVFRGNKATGSSGCAAYCPSRLHHCQFYDNVSSGNGGAILVSPDLAGQCLVSDCVISNCTAANGGAFCVAITYPNRQEVTFAPERLVVDGCTIVGCRATSSANAYGGALYTQFTVNEKGSIDGDGRTFTLFTNCTFQTNSAKTGDGGIMLAVAKDCRFFGNVKDSTNHNINGCDADRCDLTGCELTGGDLNSCAVDRCYIHDVTNTYVFKNFCHVTNTLVEGCVPSTGRITYRNFNDGTFAPTHYVNCTFVKNRGWFYTGFATNVTSVNCAYFSNTNGNGTATDISWASASTGDESHNDSVTFTNCFFGTLANTVGTVYGANNKVIGPYPRFNAGRDPTKPYYMPRYNSPLKNAGTNAGPIFTEDDLDLIGNKRLRDGQIDVGPYESDIDRPTAGLVHTIR